MSIPDPHTQRAKKKNKTSIHDEAFAKAFVATHGNGSKAMQIVKPGLSPTSAAVESNRRIRKDHVRIMILAEIAKQGSAFNPQTVSDRWNEIYSAAMPTEGEKKLGVAVKVNAQAQRLAERLLPQASDSPTGGGVQLAVGALAALLAAVGRAGPLPAPILEYQAQTIPRDPLGSDTTDEDDPDQ